MLFQLCLGKGFPILSSDWGQACFSARSVPISAVFFLPPLTQEPPLLAFKAPRPEDLYPGSGLL